MRSVIYIQPVSLVKGPVLREIFLSENNLPIAFIKILIYIIGVAKL